MEAEVSISTPNERPYQGLARPTEYTVYGKAPLERRRPHEEVLQVTQLQAGWPVAVGFA